jgi:hypothetical protein
MQVEQPWAANQEIVLAVLSPSGKGLQIFAEQ